MQPLTPSHLSQLLPSLMMKVSGFKLLNIFMLNVFSLDKAIVTLNLDSPVCSEGDGSVDVCAVITGLPAEGLGTDVAVDFNVTGDSAGIVNYNKIIM